METIYGACGRKFNILEAHCQHIYHNHNPWFVNNILVVSPISWTKQRQSNSNIITRGNLKVNLTIEHEYLLDGSDCVSYKELTQMDYIFYQVQI